MDDPAIEQLLDLAPEHWGRVGEPRVGRWLARTATWSPRERQLADALFGKLGAVPGVAWDQTARLFLVGYTIGCLFPLLRSVAAVRAFAKARGEVAGALEKGRIEPADADLVLGALNDEALLQIAAEAFSVQVSRLCASGFDSYRPDAPRASLLSWLKRCFGNAGAKQAGKEARERMGQCVHAKRQQREHAAHIERERRKVEDEVDKAKLLARRHRLTVPLQREVVELRLVQGVSHQETARRLAIKPGYVAVSLHHALKNLRRMLEKDEGK